jgi:hypothetical protein
MIDKEINQFITTLIQITFDFAPIVKVTIKDSLDPAYEGYASVVLDGTQQQRRFMMGRQAKTLLAIKEILGSFSARKGYSSGVFIVPEEGFSKSATPITDMLRNHYDKDNW